MQDVRPSSQGTKALALGLSKGKGAPEMDQNVERFSGKGSIGNNTKSSTLALAHDAIA